MRRVEIIKMLTKKEVAEKYKVSESTVNRWINRGLKCLKNNNILRFKEEDIEEFLYVKKGRK